MRLEYYRLRWFFWAPMGILGSSLMSGNFGNGYQTVIGSHR